MTKGAYVAGRTSDIDRVRLAQLMLREAGYEITFDWTGTEGEIRADWSGDAHVRGGDLAMREVRAVQEADLTVLCWLDPMEGRQGMVGALIEAGVALGAGRDLWVIGATRDSVFFHHPNVVKLRDLDALAAGLGIEAVA